MDSKKIGEFIAALRKENSMTQKELAEKLNVTNKAVSKWETGEGYPEITIIPQIAEILGVTTDELFKGERNVRAEKILEGEKQITRTVQEDYFLNSSLTKFKNFNFLGIGISLLGVIAFFTITLSSYNEILGFGIQLAFLAASGIIYSLSHNQCSSAISKFKEICPDGSQHLKCTAYLNKALVTAVWLGAFSVLITIPYIILDQKTYTKSIISFETYSIYLPIFLIAGCGIAWMFTQFIKSKLSLKDIGKEKYGRRSGVDYSIASDIYLGVLFLIIALFSHIGVYQILTFIVFLTGIIVYILITAKLVIRQESEIGGKLIIAFIVRNCIVGFALFRSISRSFWSLSVNARNYILMVDWTKLSNSLWLTVILIIVLTAPIKYLEKRLKSSRLEY